MLIVDWEYEELITSVTDAVTGLVDSLSQPSASMDEPEQQLVETAIRKWRTAPGTCVSGNCCRRK